MYALFKYVSIGHGFFFPVTIFSFNMVVSAVWTFLLCLCIWGMSHILLLLICVLYVLGYYFLRFGCSCGYASKFFYQQKIFFFPSIASFPWMTLTKLVCMLLSIHANRFWWIKIIEFIIKCIEIIHFQMAINL